MKTVFRAEHEPAGTREEYWRWVFDETIGRVEPRGLPAQVVAGEVGAVRVGEVTGSGQGGALRTARHISSSDPELCKIDLLVRGSGVIEQGGREARLAPGDFTFIDLTRPASWAVSSSVLVAVVFPRQMLGLHPDELGRLTGVRFAGDRGPGALVSSLAGRLPDHLDEWGAADGTRLGSAVLDLLTAALAARLDRSGATSAGNPPARAAVARARLHRAAAGRPGAGAADDRRRALHLAALPAQALRGRADERGRVDPPTAPGALPPGPARPGAADDAGRHDRARAGGCTTPRTSAACSGRATACRRPSSAGSRPDFATSPPDWPLKPACGSSWSSRRWSRSRPRPRRRARSRLHAARVMTATAPSSPWSTRRPPASATTSPTSQEYTGRHAARRRRAGHAGRGLRRDRRQCGTLPGRQLSIVLGDGDDRAAPGPGVPYAASVRYDGGTARTP